MANAPTAAIATPATTRVTMPPLREPKTCTRLTSPGTRADDTSGTRRDPHAGSPEPGSPSWPVSPTGPAPPCRAGCLDSPDGRRAANQPRGGGPAPADRRPARARGRGAPPRARLPPRGGARIRSTHTSVAEMAMRGRAVDLPDIGTTLQAKIVELVETGDIAALAKLRERVPVGLAEVARLDGIGPKRATALWAELGVASVNDLAAAIADGRVRDVAGFGAATEARIATELARRAEAEADDEERIPIGRALPVAEEIARDLREAVPGARVEVAGSLRRGRESVHDIDIVAADRAARGAPGRPGRPPGGRARAVARRRELVGRAPTPGCALELAVGAPEAFGNLLQHATGSAAHNIRLRELAVRQGLSVSQHGILGPGRRPGHPRRRGGGLRGPRAPPGPAGAARGPGRDRGGARGPAAAAGRARRPARRPALAHALERRHAHGRPDGRGRPGARLRLPGDQRPLAEPGHGRRPRPRPGAPAVGGDRPRERAPRRHRGAEGDRGGHPGRRPHRLRRRAAGRLRLGHRQRAFGLRPGRGALHRAGARRRREPLRQRGRAPHRADAGAARPRRDRPRPGRRRGGARAGPTWRSTASPSASTSTPTWRARRWPAAPASRSARTPTRRRRSTSSASACWWRGGPGPARRTSATRAPGRSWRRSGAPGWRRPGAAQ